MPRGNYPSHALLAISLLAAANVKQNAFAADVDSSAQTSGNATAAASASATPEKSDEKAAGYWNRDDLVPDWEGWRSKMGDSGFQPFANWTGEVWGNVNGGVRDGMTSDMRLYIGGEADLEKLAGWTGGTLRASFQWVQGTMPNHNTGAFNGPTFLEASDQLRVYNLYLRQKLMDGQVTLKVGQIGFDDDFSQPACLALFLNSGITAAPSVYKQILANGDVSLPQYPADAPGIFARFDPKDSPIYSMTAVYMSDPGPDVSNNHGFDWRGSNSATLLDEAGWNYQIAQKAGTAAVGAFYNDGRFTNWDTGAIERGVYGVYGFVNQTLCQKTGENGGDPQPVLVGFVYGGLSGPSSRTTPAYDFACGLNWNGPLPCCPKDVAGIAVLYTAFSPNYTRSAFNPNGPGATTAGETDVELTYQISVTPWFQVQPDVQVIFNPASAGTRATATVVGARATITF